MDDQAAAPPTEDPSQPRALVVDDEPAIRDLYSEVLRQMGFEVDVAEDGAAGLDRLRESFYAVIITDLRMPRITGFEFWEKSEDVRPGSGRRFIFTTGFLDFLDTKEYDLVNGKVCITKPATIEDIQAAVAGFMREVGFGAG